MRLVKHIACLHLQLKDKTQSSECSERENFFEKMIGRLYEANICLSNLIFLSLICPPQRLCACFSFPVFSLDAGYVYAFTEWTPLQTGGESLGMDAPP